MSVEHHIALAVRKARLIERIGAQRNEIAVHAAPLKKPLGWADKVVQAARCVKERPRIAGAGALVVVLLARRNLFRWAGRGWTLWRAWRFANRWLHDNGYIKIH